MDRTSLYLPRELQEEIRDLARRTGRSQASVVRDALERYLADQPTRDLSWMGSETGLGFDADEDEAILEREWGAVAGS